eukprot:2086084-Rhodomonas_salina.3
MALSCCATPETETPPVEGSASERRARPLGSHRKDCICFRRDRVSAGAEWAAGPSRMRDPKD